MTKSRIVVGIDGGGTKTRAGAYESIGVESAGALMGGVEAEAGPCNIAFMGLDDALANVDAAVSRAGIKPAGVDALCAAVAGYSFRTRRIEFAEALRLRFRNARVSVVHDFEAAFRGALPEGRGILIIAGTGSAAYGADGNLGGRSHRSGGTGYLIDDSGTGAGVGREAIAAVLAAIDGTGEPTSLTQRIAAAVGSAEWDTLIEGVYGGSIDRVRIAGLSRVVADAAAQDSDDVARHILMRAGGSLARQVEAVYRRVFGSNPQADSVPIARIGSLWNAGPSLTDVFERSCSRFAPDARLASPERGPVYGAALMARDLLLANDDRA